MLRLSNWIKEGFRRSLAYDSLLDTFFFRSANELSLKAPVGAAGMQMSLFASD